MMKNKENSNRKKTSPAIKMFGMRFTELLQNSPYKGNATAFSLVFNNGKRSSLVYDYKNGANIRLVNLIKIGRAFKIPYYELVNFNSPLPDYDFLDPLSLEKRIEIEREGIATRLNSWIRKGDTNLSIELNMPLYEEIDSSNIRKIRLGENQHELVTYEKIVNAFSKELIELFRD